MLRVNKTLHVIVFMDHHILCCSGQAARAVCCLVVLRLCQGPTPSAPAAQKMYEEAVKLLPTILPVRKGKGGKKPYKRRFEQLSPDTLYNDVLAFRREKRARLAAAEAMVAQQQQ